MAQRVESNPLEAAYAALLSQGLDGAGEALRILVNEAAKIERTEYLGAQPYERTPERRDRANGFKPKTVLTRMGELTFAVPQTRQGGFYPSALERGSRTEQALNLALAEMYVQGVSTRKVIEVLQRLVGPEGCRFPPPRSAAPPSGSMPGWRHGARGRWASRPMCCSMPATSACAKPVSSSIARCWSPSGSPKPGIVACWVCRWRCRKPKCIGARSWKTWSSAA